MSRDAGEFNLDGYLEAERGRVDGALSVALDSLLPLLPADVAGALSLGVLAPGKRLRPILCVAAFQAVRGRIREGETPPPALYDFAAAIELVHAYSLMHDDLPCMDDAPLRRGRPTPHTLHGERATILAGALLIPAAAKRLWYAGGALGLPESECRAVLRTLAQAAGGGGMVGGQGLDLLGEGRRLNRGELDDLHRRKTGALLTAPLLLGAAAARAEPAIGRALASYGAEVGLAFQIADDILDATAGAEALGKNPSDLLLEKSTYVALLGVEGARREAHARVDSALRALEEGGVSSPALDRIARYIVARDR